MENKTEMTKGVFVYLDENKHRQTVKISDFIPRVGDTVRGYVVGAVLIDYDERGNLMPYQVLSENVVSAPITIEALSKLGFSEMENSFTDWEIVVKLPEESSIYVFFDRNDGTFGSISVGDISVYHIRTMQTFTPFMASLGIFL